MGVLQVILFVVILCIVLVAIFIALYAYAAVKVGQKVLDVAVSGGVRGGTYEDIEGGDAPREITLITSNALNDYLIYDTLSKETIAKLLEHSSAVLLDDKKLLPARIKPLLQKKHTQQMVYNKVVPLAILHLHILKTLPNDVSSAALKNHRTVLHQLETAVNKGQSPDVQYVELGFNTTKLRELIDLISKRLDSIPQGNLRKLPTDSKELALKLLISELGIPQTSSSTGLSVTFLKECEEERDRLKRKVSELRDEATYLKNKYPQYPSTKLLVTGIAANPLAAAADKYRAEALQREVNRLLEDNRNLLDRMSRAGPAGCDRERREIEKLRIELAKCRSELDLEYKDMPQLVTEAEFNRRNPPAAALPPVLPPALPDNIYDDMPELIPELMAE